LTRAQLDGRTAAAKAFDALASAIAVDLGGYSELTAIERALVEGFCGAAIVLQSLNTKLALGQDVDLSEHAVVCSSMVRIAAKIGLSRRSRLINGLIEAEASPPSWSPLRDAVTKELAKRAGSTMVNENPAELFNSLRASTAALLGYDADHLLSNS
jgi:hypothetical protein